MAQSPLHQIQRQTQTVKQLEKQLIMSAAANQNDRHQQVMSLIKQLDSLSPLKIMSRGYTYVTSEEKVVNHAKQLAVGQQVQLHFDDGEVQAEIKSVKEH